MEPSRYTLALDEARRAVDQQSSDLAHIRNRTTTLVAVGGLAAAFIGGLAIRNDAPLTVWTYLGVGAFAGLLAVTTFVLWPRKFEFGQQGDHLVEWADEGDDFARMNRDLALHLAGQCGRNETKLLQLHHAHSFGLALLLIEIVSLLVDLRGR